MNCKTCNDKYFIISNSENWNDEIQKWDECNYFETDKQAQEYKKAEQYNKENIMKKLIEVIDCILFGAILFGLLFSLKYADQIDQLLISLRY